MQTTCKPTLNWLLTGGLMLGLAATSPAAVTTIADSFSLNGTTRTVGAALGGLTTEVGGATWKAAENDFYFMSAGGVTSPAGSWTAPSAAVALPAATALVTLTVGVNPYNNLDGSQWCGIGFLNSDTTNWWGGAGAPQLWVYVKDDGNWAFQCNGWNTLGSGNLGGPITGFHEWTIRYDPTTNQAKFSIDNVTLTDWTSLGAYTPTLAAAGIKIQSSPDSSIRQQFNNFAVTVPEPASLGLLLAAGGLLAGRRRHRN
jgi:hypothetical protein